MRHPGTISASDHFEARILQKVSRSFALTIPELPAALIRPVTNAYLICRIVDTIEDDAHLSLARKASFFEQFIAVLDGAMPARHFADALYPLLSDSTLPAEHELVQNTAIVMQTFFSLNERQRSAIRHCAETMAYGMLSFQRLQNPSGLETLAQMNDYCYYVAGVVGDMLTALFCDYSDKIEQQRTKMSPLAASFGQGLQMTNILKDLWEDKTRGVCWLPKDIFRKAGFKLASLSLQNRDRHFEQGLVSLVAVAHGHLQNALAYTQLFPAHETGIRKFCMWAIGLAIHTLQNINRKRDYTCGKEVKIPRQKTRRIIMISNACIRSDRLLAWYFKTAARGLPVPEKKVTASVPEPVRSSRRVTPAGRSEARLTRVV